MLKLKLFILVMVIIALPSCKKQDNKIWSSDDISTFMYNNNELKILVGFWEKNKINSIAFYGENKRKDFEVFFSPEGKLADCSKELLYYVVLKDSWIAISGIPKPINQANFTNVETKTNSDVGLIWHDTYYTTVTWSGGFVWTQMGIGEIGPDINFQTSESTSHGVDVSASGKVSVGLPALVGGVISTTLSYSFETSVTHTLSSGPGGGGYTWRYAHYQETLGITRQVVVELEKFNKLTGATSPRTVVNQYSTTVPVPLAIAGTTNYLQTSERKCQ